MKYDPTGIWFEAFKALGEPSDILFNFKIKGENQSIKHLYSHSLGDGTSAINELTDKYNFTLKKVVKKTTSPKVSFTNYLKQILMFNYYARPRKEKLWPFNFAKTTTTEIPYSYFVIGNEELSFLKERLKTQKVSLNTHLLYSLNSATRDCFKPVRKDITWMVPVNCRPELGLAMDVNGNYSANFTCSIENENPQQLQNKLSALLKEKRHLGVWFWQNTSKYMPFFLVKLATKLRLHPNYNAGVFTNLGDWTSTTDFAHFTILATPVLSHPIGASALELNGALNLGLTIYPTYPLTKEQLQDYLQAWKNNILR